MIAESPSILTQLGFGELDKTSFFTPPKPKIIGLSGKARSGKDTAAGMLKTAFNAKTVAFADPIRDAMRVLFDFNEEHFNGSLKEVVVPWIGKSPRQLMQTLGTEWGRNIVNNDIWRILAARKIEQITDSFDHAVVTDVRFENEAEMIRSMGGPSGTSFETTFRPSAHMLANVALMFTPVTLSFTTTGRWKTC